MFEGTVLVSNKKIEKALDNAEVKWLYLQNLIVGIENKLTSEVLSWSSLTRWWYTEKRHEFPHQAWYVRYQDDKCHRTVDILHEEGLLSEEDKDEWLRLERRRDHVIPSLRALIEAGGPVYLSPLQARFVNEWHEQEEAL